MTPTWLESGKRILQRAESSLEKYEKTSTTACPERPTPMTVAEWIVEVLSVVSGLVSGALTHDDAKTRMAELAAVDTGIDALERAKLGGG